jgi:hypothetical protein
MNIYLGNITFDKVESKLGYRLTKEDRIIWNKFWNSNADLLGMDSCFHIFEMPIEIHFKGEAAKNAIVKMFTPDKIVEAKGQFRVVSFK